MGHGGIQVPRFESWVRRLLSLKEAGILRGVDPLVQVGLDALAGQEADAMYLQKIIRWRTGANQAALAANRNRYGFQNPSTSGGLLVIEEFVVTNAVSGLGSFTAGCLVPATTANIAWADSRNEDQAGAAGLVQVPFTFSFDQNGASLGGFNSGSFNALSGRIERPVILAPGTTWGYFTNGLNLADAVSASGYFRPLEPSERRG